MVKVISESSDFPEEASWRVKIHLPFYDDDEDMNYTTITVNGSTKEDAKNKAMKYIKGKKTSSNSRIWKDAEVVSITRV